MTVYVPESPDTAGPANARAGDGGTAPNTARQNAFGDYFAVADRPRPHRRYGQFVGYTKILLLTMAAGLVAVLVIWPQFANKDTSFQVGVSDDILPEDVASLRVTNARLTGINKNGNPFTVTFDNASRTNNDSDLVQLAGPNADVELASGAWIALSAEKGRIHRANRIIELDDPVRLYHDSGLEIGTGNITFNLATGTGAGHDPLTVQAPFGQLESQGFRIRENGSVFHFNGPVRAVLYSVPNLGQ